MFDSVSESSISMTSFLHDFAGGGNIGEITSTSPISVSESVSSMTSTDFLKTGSDLMNFSADDGFECLGSLSDDELGVGVGN